MNILPYISSVQNSQTVCSSNVKVIKRYFDIVDWRNIVLFLPLDIDTDFEMLFIFALFGVEKIALYVDTEYIFNYDG